MRNAKSDPTLPMELESYGLPDAADLLGSFADLYADHGVASAVEIMTIHKAKGLEFDMVVVAGLDRPVPLGRDQLLLSHQFARTGRDGMVMAARGRLGGDSDRLFEFLRHQLRDAAGLEAQRLLYVACTRAKHRLELTATIDGTPRAGSLLAVLWPVARAEFAVTEPGPAMQGPGVGPPRGGPLCRVPVGWTPGLDMGPPSVESMSGLPPVREETPIFDWAGETARRVGTLVHAELQTMDMADGDGETIRAREPNFRRWLALHGVPPERLANAASLVVEALAAVHRDPRGRWILKKSREDFRELALSGRLPRADAVPGSGRGQDDVVRVIIDRSFVDEHGVRWVIDYKTSRHLGGGLDEFLDREVERYRPQLQRYAMLVKKLGPQPVRVGLYFPLMRAWREWPA